MYSGIFVSLFYKAVPSYGDQSIRIDTTIRYQLKRSHKDRALRIVIYLWLDDNNQIVRHEDRFSDVKPTTKEEKPFIGSIFDVCFLFYTSFMITFCLVLEKVEW